MLFYGLIKKLENLDEMGDAHDLGPAFLINYMSQKGAEVLMSDMMPKAGFQNIRLEQTSLSPDGALQSVYDCG